MYWKMKTRYDFRERFNYYDSGRSARRLRILDVDINEEGDKAYVTVAIDNFRQGGLFDSGTSTYRRTSSPRAGGWGVEDRHRRSFLLRPNTEE